MDEWTKLWGVGHTNGMALFERNLKMAAGRRPNFLYDVPDPTGKKTFTINLEAVHPALAQQAIRAFQDGDPLSFVSVGVSGHGALALVFDNTFALRERGMFEAALVQAYCGVKSNHAHWGTGVIRDLLKFANRQRLRAAADPLPGSGPFRVYRGVSGKGRARKVKGLSWTSSLEVACWFAYAGFVSPAVHIVDLEEDNVFFYTNKRNEFEFVADTRGCKCSRWDLNEAEMKALSAARNDRIENANKLMFQQCLSKPKRQLDNLAGSKEISNCSR